MEVEQRAAVAGVRHPIACALYWFRNDLRVIDNPAFADACARAKTLVPVYVIAPEEQAPTRWGFARWSGHRRRFRDQAVAGLRAELRRRGSDLISGAPSRVYRAGGRSRF